MFQDFVETLPKLAGYHGKDLFGIWSKVYDPLFCEVKEGNIKINLQSDFIMYAYFEIKEYFLLLFYKCITYISFNIET